MRFRKALGAILLALILTVLLAVPAFAETKTEDLFYLDERTNMAIRIDYDTHAPAVSFIAPDDTVFDDTAITEGRMFKTESEKALLFQIPGAQAGQWKISYDKGSNKELHISWGSYAEGISIQYFRYTQEEDKLHVQFLVDHSTKERYSYTISAVILDEAGEVIGSKPISTGNAYANVEQTQAVYLRDLNSHDQYSLMLHVTMESSGVEVFDQEVADKTFSYTTPDIPEALASMRVQIGVSETYLNVQWDDPDQYSITEYLLSVYEDDGAEPAYFTQIPKDQFSHEVVMAHTASKYRIELRHKKSDGVYSAPVIKNVDLSMKDLLTIPALDVTNALQVPVSFDFSRFQEKVKTVVSVNGTEETMLLSGKNSVSVNLDNNQNKFAVTWWADESLSFQVSATIYSDRIAPMLQLYEFASGTATTAQANYILVGSTTAGCKVTVGGKPAEVDASGVFKISIPLQVGENEIAVVSTSPSGNSAQQTVQITRTAAVIVTTETGKTATLLQWLPLMLSVVFVLLLCGHLLLSRRMILKRKGTMFRGIKGVISNSFILLALASVVGVAWTLIAFIQADNAINSVEFYHVAERSVPEAYQMLLAQKACKKAMIIACICFGASLVLAIGVRLIPSDLFVKMKEKSEKKAQARRIAKEQQARIAREAEEARITRETAQAVPPVSEQTVPAPATQEIKSEQIPGKRFCISCGAENDADKPFCISCGARMHGFDQGEDHSSNP